MHKNSKKKLLIGIGTFLGLSIPLVTILSCCKNNDRDEKGTHTNSETKTNPTVGDVETKNDSKGQTKDVAPSPDSTGHTNEVTPSPDSKGQTNDAKPSPDSKKEMTPKEPEVLINKSDDKTKETEEEKTIHPVTLVSIVPSNRKTNEVQFDLLFKEQLLPGTQIKFTVNEKEVTKDIDVMSNNVSITLENINGLSSLKLSDLAVNGITINLDSTKNQFPPIKTDVVLNSTYHENLKVDYKLTLDPSVINYTKDSKIYFVIKDYRNNEEKSEEHLIADVMKDEHHLTLLYTSSKDYFNYGNDVDLVARIVVKDGDKEVALDHFSLTPSKNLSNFPVKHKAIFNIYKDLSYFRDEDLTSAKDIYDKIINFLRTKIEKSFNRAEGKVKRTKSDNPAWTLIKKSFDETRKKINQLKETLNNFIDFYRLVSDIEEMKNKPQLSPEENIVLKNFEEELKTKGIKNLYVYFMNVWPILVEINENSSKNIDDFRQQELMDKKNDKTKPKKKKTKKKTTSEGKA
ncbi:hypothetical protein [Ureaplasma canigenitalium]|uniref:hypothetical protein n=1 Tax=Ureaplasma canigenitalium TaxID=42092 RepID=UPI0004E23B80|nr:hypothetical protein [Ureaplasma canigenitalium]